MSGIDRIRRFAQITFAAAAVSTALVAAGMATAAVTSYNIDPVHSGATFKVRHLVSMVEGRFTDFAGVVNFDDADPTRSTVELTIQTASINTGMDMRDKHLRSGDFFAADSFPTITFKSTKVEKADQENVYKVTGDLTLRGVTKPVVLTVHSLGTSPNGMGGTVAGFDAQTSINRLDYGVRWNKKLDNGGSLLGEDVQIEFPIEAVHKAS